MLKQWLLMTMLHTIWIWIQMPNKKKYICSYKLQRVCAIFYISIWMWKIHVQVLLNLLNREIDRNLSILLLFILQKVFQMQVLKGKKVVTTPFSLPFPISSRYCDPTAWTWSHAIFSVNLLWSQIRKSQIPELINFLLNQTVATKVCILLSLFLFLYRRYHFCIGNNKIDPKQEECNAYTSSLKVYWLKRNNYSMGV